ncbi:MAG TPA: BTAD domain-containing putative transcriptional regulator [Gemmatimonadaceae bacterium]
MPAPMYRLETFGKLALIGGTGGSLSHQRRRLALLALVSAAGERGLSRDQLMGYLWPESTAANGRHSLEQQIHGLRRTFGESLFIGVNPVRLNPDVISSDVGDFDRAIARGELADGVALYGGPFLQGFYLDDAPEFERWADSERRRLATRYAEALDRLAENAAQSGNHADAVRWRRRLVEADHLSSRFALGLMRALAAAGDRTAALQHARIYEALVREELESDPDPSVTKYAAELRSGLDETVLVPAARTGNETASPAPPTEPSPPPVSAELEIPARVEAEGKERRNLWIAGVALVAIVVVGAVSWFNRKDAPALDSNKIVVIPFRTTSADSSVHYLREGVVDLISPMLTGEGGPSAVDARTAISTWNRVTRGREGTADDARAVARALGAERVLTGSFVEAGGRLTVNGSVISGSTGEIRRLTSVTGTVDSVNKLLDAFVAQLLARESRLSEPSISTLTSHSLPAVRAYLDGRAAYRRADEDRANESFTRALEIDSTFALAAFELALSTGKILRNEICRGEICRVFSIVPGFAPSDQSDDVFDRAVGLAWDYRSKLGKRDLPLLEALHGSEYPRVSSAREILSNLRRAISAAPDRPEAQYLLGVLLLYQGPALGLPDSRASAVSAFQIALALDSSYLAPRARLVDAAAFARDTAALRNAAGTYLTRDSTGATAQYVRWLLAAFEGENASRQASRESLRRMHPTALEQIYLTGQMTGIGGDDLDEAVKITVAAATDPQDKAFAYRRAEVLALNRGQPARAASLLRNMDAAVRATGSASNFLTFAMAGAMFSDGDRALADSAARDLAMTLSRDTLRPLTRNEIRRTSVAMSLQSLWYLDNGDTARAAAAARWLRRHVEGQPRNRVLLALPEMLIASRSRKPEGTALRALVDSIALAGCCQLPDFVNLALARAFEESGDDAGALRVTRRGSWYFPPRFMTSYLRQEGRVAARIGDQSGAIRAYEHYLALRSNPEPRLRAQRDSVQAEVNRLKRSR